MITWGTRPNGSPWQVGISNPDTPELVQFGIPLENMAIATSGSYEKYFTHQGKRYAHIIDPKTGYPITDKKSVTVISPSAELSDALATAFFVLDTEVALNLASQLPQVYCLIIDS
ncbi:MAG: FAD:protein FMN transferase [Owenweeksia sp.]|nr:FAD:protein FMN transferase [Owenweeksia sp.]